MIIKLSPEQYLTYPVAVQTAKPAVRISVTTEECEDEPFLYRFRNGNPPHGSRLVEALRNVRFETLDADLNFMNLATAEDSIEKYCIPVQKVTNSIMFSDRTPELQLLRGTVYGGRYDFPTAVFVSGRQMLHPFSKTAYLQTNRWHTPLHPNLDNDKGPPDWNKVNKCFVVVCFVPPGAINPDELTIDSTYHLPDVSGITRDALAGLMDLARNVRATYAILTDELSFVILSFDHCDANNNIPFLSIKLVEDCPVRMMISTAVYAAAYPRGLVRISAFGSQHRVQGALNDFALIIQDGEVCKLGGKKTLSDFDLYTMQRIPEVWLTCAQLHYQTQQEARNNPITPDSVISFEPGGFAQRFGLLRSPYPIQPIPQDTDDSLRGRAKRPRNHALDRILGSSQKVSLTIVEATHTGRRHFSQVFEARVADCDETFCVKLFDERFFPIPWMHDPECIIGSPDTRLLSLNFPEDLARREEGVYDRLFALQGSLLPHCYGFHMFTLPDGFQCFGLVMEKINGPTLGSAFPLYAEETKISVITQMRHGVRVLRANGISQTDWHLSQVLCLPRDDSQVDVVLIDFAFALMYLGDEGGILTRSDLSEVQQLFSWDLDVETDFLEKYWLDPLEFEY